MNRLKTLSASALFLLLGFTVPAIARQEKQEEKAKPPKQEQPAKSEKQEQAKPQKQEQAKPEKQEHRKSQQQAKGQQEQQQKQQQQQAKSSNQQHPQVKNVSSHGAPQRSEQAMSVQRSQPELRLSERGSGRIPDDRFRSHFGNGHHFHMGNPVMVGGYSRFQYGGYWFGFVDPWPADWYYTDDFYIDYVDGGYYMYNPYYPGARFAITVVL